MNIEQDFGEGEIYEIEVKFDRSGRIDHVAHYPIKSGPRTYKSLNVFEIPQKDGDDRYILTFWKAKERNDILNTYDKSEFKCEKEEVVRLLSFLDNLYELDGLDRGDHVILKKNSPSTEAAASAVEAIKSCEDGNIQDLLLELIGSLTDLRVDLEELDLSDQSIEREALKAEYAIKHARTKSVLAEFKQKVGERESESDYQEFLEENPWLFGQEYVERIEIRELTRNEEVDFCYKSVDGFYDVIEIKKPETRVLVEDSSHETHKASSELSSAIAQVENYIYRIEQSQGTILQRDGLDMVKPRGKIVIGDSLTDEERESLRILNSHLNRITVYTFSDVVKLGERLVNRYENEGSLPTQELSTMEE